MDVVSRTLLGLLEAGVIDGAGLTGLNNDGDGSTGGRCGLLGALQVSESALVSLAKVRISSGILEQVVSRFGE